VSAGEIGLFKRESLLKSTRHEKSLAGLQERFNVSSGNLNLFSTFCRFNKKGDNMVRMRSATLIRASPKAVRRQELTYPDYPRQVLLVWQGSGQLVGELD
jgi:hypothetical protein